MSVPEQPLTLMEAIDRARAAGLAVDVMAGFASRTHDLLLSLETVDPDPTLSVRLDRTRATSLLSSRDQSAPERWEYPYSFTEYHDRFFLRVVSEEKVVDVPLLPAVFGIVERHGLVEDLALSSPARVDREVFARAIALLTQSEQREVQRRARGADSSRSEIVT